jgi:hypothetical protein
LPRLLEIFYNNLQLKLSRTMPGEQILTVDDESHMVELAKMHFGASSSRASRCGGQYRPKLMTVNHYLFCHTREGRVCV